MDKGMKRQVLVDLELYIYPSIAVFFGFILALCRRTRWAGMYKSRMVILFKRLNTNIYPQLISF
jgi:hypothetical protein